MKTEQRCVGSEKSKIRAMKLGNSLWTNKQNKKGIKNQRADQT